MSDLSNEQLTELIRLAVREEMASTHICPLEEVGIGGEVHKEHHKLINSVLKDMLSARRAFICGVVATITGGILGLLWIAIKNRIL